MAKITVCDVCKNQKGILVETNRRTSIKGFSELRLDVCTECSKALPKDMLSYIKFVNKILNPNMEMTDEEIKKLYGGRIKL